MIVWEGVGQELVEYVIVSLGRLLKRDTRLLEQVRLNVGAGNFARRTEVNANKFALKKKTYRKPKI